ncbi:hypothetical protein A3I95_00680 [Candidatus Nomurabacteria bacterium RIFCSPLOWO2_02_FULL_44_12]|uniref:Uncharacterized protein n=1 Tax=Candidatus Nomurabacteria bacterium RIFCSPLOWO2_12_FULL_44_11 TaxID=1801796 RepID=A0A1F6Y6S1_9BACT|nr:MAG: hypothetical protein A3E95_00535 [Candidatus Nomurabacteria bacterium RIFCSPHIGHO2_12_FULL_44_22b]OGJ02063.1 MAG: hypothetical protein A3G53_03210 [Candidatus Nomurabacteria bacterium RIFCSPLOWO2_12_FULL_44_11]OGJ08706.1 MAG: hypothetical protein A3I95_00680 [Candidatus Nomurabacteria bacterium RIFCSPLOWO2_02_FULL_44_12]
MKRTTKNKMSIEDLALSMNRGFKKVENLIKSEVDGLAISTAKGFENTATKIDIEGLKGQIQGVDKRIDDFVATRVKHDDHNKLKTRVDLIEQKLESKSK